MATEICDELRTVSTDEVPRPEGCEDCLAIGGQWVHLRQCVECGHVGCCDSSPNRHASKHARAEEHPVVKSAEPDERWAYCFTHELTVGY